MKKQPLFMAFVLLALQGCSSFFTPVGENKFDCNRRQGGNSEFCRSFKAMNKSTDAPLPESRFDKDLSMSEFDRATGIAPDSPASPKSSNPSNSINLTGASKTMQAGTTSKPVVQESKVPLVISERSASQNSPIGRPIRVAPVVQRTWIKPFVSGQDMHGAVLVYREIIPSRWLGFEDSTNSKIKSGASGSYPHFVQSVGPSEKTSLPAGQKIKQDSSADVKNPQNPSMSSQPNLAKSLTQPRDDVAPGVSLDGEADSKPR
jgi:type IV conjugative transfer system lipoprotein TraV